MELQLLEGANTRLSNRKRSDRPYWELHTTIHHQTRRLNPKGPCRPCYNLDAPVGVSVPHGAIVCYASCAMENAPVHLWKEDGRNKDLPYTTPLWHTSVRMRPSSHNCPPKAWWSKRSYVLSSCSAVCLRPGRPSVMPGLRIEISREDRAGPPWTVTPVKCYPKAVVPWWMRRRDSLRL